MTKLWDLLLNQAMTLIGGSMNLDDMEASPNIANTCREQQLDRHYVQTTKC